MIKSKKRIVSMLAVLAMVLVMMPAMAFADAASETAEVYVTIADEGSLVMTQQKVTVTDIDADGALTINDALYAAHEAAFEGGAAAGYGSGMSSWGLSITKLWGDTSGAFGYYVNDLSAWSLTDPVKNGDYVNAYIYKDQTGWSDSYSYFDKKNVTAEAGEAFELTLSYVGYDANWNKVFNPAAGAVITVDGTATEFVTDTDGKVTVTLEEGVHVISATSESMILVPAVCVANVTAAPAAEMCPVCGNALDAEGNCQYLCETCGKHLEEDFLCHNVCEYCDSHFNENGECPLGCEEIPLDTDGNQDGAEVEDKTDKTDSTPQTGDDFNAALYGFIAMAALAAAAFCLRRTCK